MVALGVCAGAAVAGAVSVGVAGVALSAVARQSAGAGIGSALAACADGDR